MGFADLKKKAAEGAGNAPNTSAAAARQAAPGARRPGRYSGLKMREPKVPRPENGKYVFEIGEVSRQDSKNPKSSADEFLKVELKIVATDTNAPVGTTRVWTKSWNKKTFEQYALPEILTFLVHATGNATQDEFESNVEDWEDLLDTVLGTPCGAYAQTPQPLKGEKVCVEIVDSKNVDAEGKPYADWIFFAYSEGDEEGLAQAR
jgi:hypothetical protein